MKKFVDLFDLKITQFSFSNRNERRVFFDEITNYVDRWNEGQRKKAKGIYKIKENLLRIGGGGEEGRQKRRKRYYESKILSSVICTIASRSRYLILTRGNSWECTDTLVVIRHGHNRLEKTTALSVGAVVNRRQGPRNWNSKKVCLLKCSNRDGISINLSRPS